MPTTTADLERLLREAGLRVTRPRLAVLSAVHDRQHADTESLIGAVRVELPKVSHQAVYDALRVLTAVGLVRRIQPMGSVARYEARVGDNHHHLVCRHCGRAVEVSDPPVEDWAERIAREYGFTEVGHTVEITGTCPSCAEQQ